MKNTLNVIWFEKKKKSVFLDLIKPRIASDARNAFFFPCNVGYCLLEMDLLQNVRLSMAPKQVQQAKLSCGIYTDHKTPEANKINQQTFISHFSTKDKIDLWQRLQIPKNNDIFHQACLCCVELKIFALKFEDLMWTLQNATYIWCIWQRGSCPVQEKNVWYQGALFCDTDLPPSQHYPKKCISSPIRNSSAALILSPFKCNVFFLLLLLFTYHSVVHTTDQHLNILWHLIYLNYVHTYTLVIFIDFWSL